MTSAGRFFERDVRSFVKNLTVLHAHAVVGSSGAISSITGTGVASMSKLATGVYKIVLSNAYPKLVSAHCEVIAGVTGGAIADESLVTGTLYQILTVGTTNFTALGAAANLVGVPFVATGAGSGTGTAKAVTTSKVSSCQVVNGLLTNIQTILVQFVNDAGELVEPEAGCTLALEIVLRGSGVDNNGV